MIFAVFVVTTAAATAEVHWWLQLMSLEEASIAVVVVAERLAFLILFICHL